MRNKHSTLYISIIVPKTCSRLLTLAISFDWCLAHIYEIKYYFISRNWKCFDAFSICISHFYNLINTRAQSIQRTHQWIQCTHHTTTIHCIIENSNLSLEIYPYEIYSRHRNIYMDGINNRPWSFASIRFCLYMGENVISVFCLKRQFINWNLIWAW